MSSSGAANSPNFTYGRYREIVSTFLKRGYEVRGYADADPRMKHLILRHDVDFCPNEAVKMAQVEADLGVWSHYYFLLQTEFYNIASAASLSAISTIRSLGHKIGLHFDASLFPDQRDGLDRAATVQSEIMEKLIGSTVQTVSFHRPAPSLLGDPTPLGGRIHTYQPRFFSEMAYVSDSGGSFSYGEPLDHPAFSAGTAMQLLTHPIWWKAERVENRMELLDRFLAKRAKVLDTEAQINCYPYADWAKERPLGAY